MKEQQREQKTESHFVNELRDWSMIAGRRERRGLQLGENEVAFTFNDNEEYYSVVDCN